MIDIDKKFREITKREVKLSIILLSSLVIVFILSFFWYKNHVETKYWSHKKLAKEDSIYLKMDNFTKEWSKVFLNYNDQKIYLDVHNNREYKPHWFVSFIQRGDSIAKNSETDTLKVIRENEIYYWTIISE